MKKIVYLCWCFFIVVGLSQAQAIQSDPVKLMQSLTTNVENEIKKNRVKIDSDPKVIYRVVDQVVLPHVDFVEMAKWIAGKSAWSAASIADQEAFIKEFKILVVSTYATTLNKYSDEKIEFLPMKKSASNTRVQISSKIHRTNKSDVSVDYRLIAADDDWKLYDIIVEGVSILQGFQAQFSEQIHHTGLKSVIQKIKLHNEGKG